jgi:hypothetical protein
MRAHHPPELLAALETFLPRFKGERILCEKLRASLSGPPQQPQSKHPVKTRREKEFARRGFKSRARKRAQQPLSNAEHPSKRVHSVSEQYTTLPAQQFAQKRPAAVPQNPSPPVSEPQTTQSAGTPSPPASEPQKPESAGTPSPPASEPQTTQSAGTPSPPASEPQTPESAGTPSPPASEPQTPGARDAPNNPPSQYSLRWPACLIAFTLLPLPPSVRTAAFVLLCWHLLRHC